jgi:hypothetical protein
MITKDTKPKDHYVVPNETALVAAPDFQYRCTVCGDAVVWEVDFGGWMHAAPIKGADGRVSMWAPDWNRYSGV